MTVFTPSWKLTVEGVDYTDVTIANVSHNAGRKDIYSQPSASYLQCSILAFNGQVYPFDVNDGIALQVKDSTNTYVSLFGGNITDLIVEVGETGQAGTEIKYTIIALGTLARLSKEVYNGTLSKDFDGNQMLALLAAALTNSWNELPAGETWSGYDPTITWANAENVGLGEIDTPGLYEMENRGSSPDTIYNIASQIAKSAFGYMYEDNQGNIGYADADHRQDYLTANGYVQLTGNHAIGRGLKTATKSGDIRNDIYINYGNNFNSQKTATSPTSIATYGYKFETINSSIHDATNAQEVADRYISQRALPLAVFDTITFPITSSEIDDADRDALLGIFMGQPLYITDLPIQISSGEFEGYVEGWSWSSSFNQLFLTINLSPVAFSQVSMRWSTVPIDEAWNTLSNTLTWEYATIVA
jgi:hypothetical protein